MKDNANLTIETVYAEAHDWRIVDHYEACLAYKSFGDVCVRIDGKGYTVIEALEKIVVRLDYEIEDLIKIRDEIKTMYKQ